MGFFKRKTTKNVGRDIGRSMAESKKQEKILRTLEHEKKERVRRANLSDRIKKLKSERPSMFRTLRRTASKVGAGVSKQTQAFAKRSAKIQKKREKGVKFRRKKLKKTLTKQRRQTRAVVRQPTQTSSNGGYSGSFYN